MLNAVSQSTKYTSLHKTIRDAKISMKKYFVHIQLNWLVLSTSIQGMRGSEVEFKN